MIVVLLLILFFVVSLEISDYTVSRKIGGRHDDFVAARPPWHGRSWEEKDAVLYRDVDHPLTWHACTVDGCGVYFEAGEAQK